mmetsp:Transcript_12727/g.18501  ORF Transcript_12727/g.18501 Transcript_12727/m.18501 type:complete len:331 (+) Transcript_12727:99-1091(+)
MEDSTREIEISEDEDMKEEDEDLEEDVETDEEDEESVDKDYSESDSVSTCSAKESQNVPPSEEPTFPEEEADAIAEATKAAYENYKPSQSLLKNPSPYPLIRSVDGISLKKYNADPSVFSAKDVIVPLRGKFSVPVHVTSSGSVVDYTVESTNFDVGFGIVAEREEGITVVKEKMRVDSHQKAITGRFLVGSVPCALIFTFDNEYSWFREKKITYKIKITPPSIESVAKGRRARARSALDVVKGDKMSAESRLGRVSTEHVTLLQLIDSIEKELEEKRKSLGVIEKEEHWLKDRVELRIVQENLLTRRLADGWEDESNRDESAESERAEI